MIHEPTKLEYLKVENNSDTLIILLHGYGASQHDLFGLHEYLGEFDFIFPNGPLEIPMGWISGFAWFPIDMEELNRSMLTGEKRRFEDKNPEMLNSSIEKVLKLAEDLGAKYKNVFIGGFSQGSMITSHVVALRPDLFNGFILFSSALINKLQLENNLRNNQIKIPFIQSHGRGDGVLNYFDAKEMYEFMQKMGLQGEFVSFHGAHEIPMEVIQKTRQFLLNNIE
jgi:phospholipase/carboxylesterase